MGIVWWDVPYTKPRSLSHRQVSDMYAKGEENDATEQRARSISVPGEETLQWGLWGRVELL